ncbi:quinon protein alcohol dehydrogenase-like superfamily [Apiospora arundinis]|uniref:Quinon protein alcohol dehydrogenase-like superfamily n=1 Tax=Apiospora arundinis TaxID=335852 RepID=A0ABR2J813_9PEZI
MFHKSPVRSQPLPAQHNQHPQASVIAAAVAATVAAADYLTDTNINTPANHDYHDDDDDDDDYALHDHALHDDDHHHYNNQPAHTLLTHHIGDGYGDNDTHMTTHYVNPYWPQYNSSASSSADSGDAGDDNEMEEMHHGGVTLAGDESSPSSYHHTPSATHTTLFTMAHATEAMDDDFDDSISLGDDDNMEAVSAAHHMAHTQQYTLPPIMPSQPIPELIGNQLPPINPPHLGWQPQLPPGFVQAFFTGDDMTEEELGELHPVPISNQMSLAPENLNFVDFLRIWAENGRGKLPDIRRLRAQLRDVGPGSTRVEYNQLHGNKCDLQGIDWEDLGVPRRVARERRMMTYRNYTNKSGSEEWHPTLPDRMLRPTNNYYRFRNMSLRRDVRLLHFQLRNILGCASRTRAFFPSHGYVKEIDPTNGRSQKAMDFDTEGDMQVSTLTATNDILMVGCFNGDYRFRSLHSENLSYAEGRLTDNMSGITNHVEVYPCRRSSAPLAAFSSNDYGFRMVDLTTNSILSETKYDYPLNCTAISPDKRLRVMVGDCMNVLIADAETGETLQNLEGHRDFGFACDWAPDGWTVATGFQDKSVRIWDARMWRRNYNGAASPLAVLRMEMSGARSLRFSPLGSGKRVLVAAEEADIVNIIDAQTFETKQKIDVFGEIGGTAFADDGQNLLTLVTDQARGGLMSLDRCDAGAEDSYTYCFDEENRQDWSRRPPKRHEVVSPLGPHETVTHRRRMALVSGNLDPF